MKIKVSLGHVVIKNLPKLMESHNFQASDISGNKGQCSAIMYSFIAREILGYGPITTQSHDMIAFISEFPRAEITLENKQEAETIKMLMEVAAHYEDYKCHPKD